MGFLHRIGRGSWGWVRRLVPNAIFCQIQRNDQMERVRASVPPCRACPAAGLDTFRFRMDQALFARLLIARTERMVRLQQTIR
jgi:hypothetical protein